MNRTPDRPLGVAVDPGAVAANVAAVGSGWRRPPPGPGATRAR